MGNIQREVLPFRVKSLLRREPKAVKMISKHQPVRPQCKKEVRNLGAFINLSFLIESYGLVWTGKVEIYKAGNRRRLW